MAPEHGDTKHEGGLDWIYHKPPGAWIVMPGHSALERALGQPNEFTWVDGLGHAADAKDSEADQDPS